MDSLPIVRQAERLHAQVRPQAEQVLAPGFNPRGGQHTGSRRSSRPIHCRKGIGIAPSGSRP